MRKSLVYVDKNQLLNIGYIEFIIDQTKLSRVPNCESGIAILHWESVEITITVLVTLILPFPTLSPPSPSLPFQPRAEFQSVIKGCYSKKFVDYNVTYVISKYSLQNKSMILFELNLH